MWRTLLLGFIFCSLLPEAALQFSVTWNETTISGPVLIYQDELIVDNRPDPTDTPIDGTLVCRSEDQARVRWHHPSGLQVHGGSTVTDFRQRQTEPEELPSVSRLTVNLENRNGLMGDLHNGLWTCQLNDHNPIPVGIYSRDGGFGAITTTQVSAYLFSSFLSDPPTFTLFGDTSGGPPTTSTWTRDGQVISNDASFTISLQPTAFQESNYRSTLTVTGRLPGEYQYSVSNRATFSPANSSFTVEGTAPPTNVVAEQTGPTTVNVTWTAPATPPTSGYQVSTTEGSTTTIIATSGTAHTFEIVDNQYGVYSIGVRALSQHLPSETTELEVTTRGPQPPVISTETLVLTATSVTLTWSQPEFSLPLDGYTVTVSRQSSQTLCPEEGHSITTLPLPSVTTTSTVTGLQEFSNYEVRVTANFSPEFGLSSLTAEGNITVTTLSAVPTGAPLDITPSTTSRSVSVSWGAIECIERNGEITDYTVVFQEQGGAMIPGEVNVMDRTFTASGLTPHTNYTFRVAGVNSNGIGPFSDSATITTDEDFSSAVSNLMGQPQFASIVLTWNAPQEPNGVIISYEVSYRVGDGDLVTTNTTDLSTTFTISSLTPGSNVTEISVSAYTAVGRGELSYLITLSTLSVIANVEVEVASASSVRVLWDSLDIPEITGYMVYYSQMGNREDQIIEQSISVTNSADSVVLGGLAHNEEYQFQVAAVGVINGHTIVGQRSASVRALIDFPTSQPMFVSTQVHTTGIAIAVVVTLVLVLLLYTSFMLLVVCCVSRHQAKNKLATEQVNATQVQAIQEEIDATRVEEGLEMNENEAYGPVEGGLEMKENEAYGPVSSSQLTPNSPASEPEGDYVYEHII